MSQASIPMKPPVQIREAYVAPGDEFRQFPGHTYLSRDEVSTAFPLGSISHERFSHLGLRWRIIKRSSNQVPGGHLFVAVMDDQANPPSPGRRWPSDTSVPESNGRSALRSVRSGPLALEGHLDGHLSSHHLDEATPASPHEHDSHDCSPLPNGHGSHNHHQSSLHKSYSTGPGSGHHQSTFSHTMNGIHASQSAKQIVPSGPNRTQSSYSTRPLLGAATSWPHRPQSVVSGPPAAVASSYRYQLSQDLVTCNEAATAMERYKAFWRLFGTLSRLRGEVWDARRAAWEAHKQHVAQNASAATGRRFRRSGSPTGNGPRSADSSSSGGVNSSTMNSPSDGHDGKASHSGGTSTRGSLELSTCDPRLPSSWVDNEDAHDLLRHTVMVGEALAKFGNTAFVASSGGSGGDNATRAITAKDYGELLRQYLKDNGGMFSPYFVAGLPPGLQDEMVAIATLLKTRCEANQVVYDQLVKHVGMEGRGGAAGGGALVINTSTVTANPINRLLAAPVTQNWLTAASSAWSKSDNKRRMQLGGLGAVAVVALFVLGKRLRPGRQRDDEGRYGHSVPSYYMPGAPWPTAQSPPVERRAVRHVALCNEQLRRAARNDELLRNDWRLGPIRLALPGAGNVPEGYQPLDANACTLERFLDGLEGQAALQEAAERALAAHPLVDAPAVGPATNSASGRRAK